MVKVAPTKDKLTLLILATMTNIEYLLSVQEVTVQSLVNLLNKLSVIEGYRLAPGLNPVIKQALDGVCRPMADVVCDCLEEAQELMRGGCE